MILRDGKLYAIELKSKVGKVSAMQEYTLRKMNENGAVTAVCRSLEDVICTLN